MEKFRFNYPSYYIYILLAFIFVCSSFCSVNLNECDCCFYEEEITEEPIDYESLEEFEEIFREFERKIDSEEFLEDAQSKGFFKKWCKKLKTWFKKKTFKIFRKMVGLKKVRNAEECAYTIAKFKRKIDKKLYHTGSIDKMFTEFDEHANDPSYTGVNEFKDRIRFYYKNKNAKPPVNAEPSPYDEDIAKINDQLKEVPTKALSGMVQVGCGAIITFLPFPYCRELGIGIITSGFHDIWNAYVEKSIEDQEKMQRQLDK